MKRTSITPLIYALKDGHFVGINEVPTGRLCGCVCPLCGEKLIARNKGKIMQHHFAHSANSKCIGAAETALHLMAKEILKESRKLLLPDYDDYNGSVMTFDDIILEQRQKDSGLQPDCIGIKSNHQLWIEFKVNHAVDASKLESIIKNKQGCIEIDLLHFLDREYTREDLQHFLSCVKSHKEWLYIKNYYEKREKKKEEREATEKGLIEKRLKNNHNEHLFPLTQCTTCKFHSTRIAISQLLYNHIRRYRDMIAEIEKTSIRTLKRPLVYREAPPRAVVVCGNSYIQLYNIKKEGEGHRLYYFFRTILPTEVIKLGEKCNHLIYHTLDNKIICNCPYLPNLKNTE